MRLDAETLATEIDAAIDWDYVEVFRATEEDEGFDGYPTYDDLVQGIVEALLPVVNGALVAAHAKGFERGRIVR